MKTYSFPITIGITVVMIIAFIGWARANQTTPTIDNSDVVTTKGLHAHPQLEIYVKGEKIQIPANIGLGTVHNPVHTHDDVPLIHHEFGGVVTHEDLKLKKFFEVWGKDILSFGDTVTMTVNGVSNTELGEYEMQDGDKIILNYE